MRIRFLFFATLALLGVSCGNGGEYLAVSGGKTSTYYHAMKTLINEWNRSGNCEIRDIFKESANSNTNVQMLADGKVDICIAQNDAVIQIKEKGKNMNDFEDIRTLLPLYPEIFFIVHKDEIQAENLKDLVSGRTVSMGPETSGTAFFVKRFFAEFGIDTTMYSPYYNDDWSKNTISDSVDVACILTAFNYNDITEMLNRKGGKLFSVGDPAKADKGSAVDGFCWNYYPARPFIIPIGTYGSEPSEPVLTVAIDAVINIDKDVENETVYKLVETMLQHKQKMVSENIIFSGITTEFNPDNLGFPLHEGTRQYLNKDKPTFLEKWSESMALGFSIIIALAGGISSFIKWKNMRKKDRIDKYYKRLLDIQDEIETITDKGEISEYISKIQQIRKDAFAELIKEKLLANESFLIFTELLDNTLQILRLKLAEK